MRKYVIVADATCDLGVKDCEEYGVRIIPGHAVLPDGRELTLTPGWDEIGKSEFYEQLKKQPNDFMTSPASIDEFAAVFEEYVSNDTDVICITISSGLSGAGAFAKQAAAQVMEKYPESKVVCVDSMRFGPGFGLMTMNAALMCSSGKTMDETVAYLEDNKNRYHQAGWLDDLNFVAKKGRITQAKAFMGTLVGVKTIGEFDYNGLTTVIGKVTGAKKAYKALLEYVAQTIENPEDQVIVIAESNREAAAETYKKMLEEKFHPKAVIIRELHPLCAINVGPGLMAAYYVGKPISADLSEEKALLESITSAEK